MLGLSFTGLMYHEQGSLRLNFVPDYLPVLLSVNGAEKETGQKAKVVALGLPRENVVLFNLF